MAAAALPPLELPPLVELETGAQSYDPPSADALNNTRAMYAYVQEAAPLESKAGTLHRERCLKVLKELLADWVRRMAMAHGIPAEVAGDCGSTIFVSGSFRLGVCGPGSDIDVICVVPSFCGGEAPGPRAAPHL